MIAWKFHTITGGFANVRAFYGLRERPFDLTTNPRFLLLTGKHREAAAICSTG